MWAALLQAILGALGTGATEAAAGEAAGTAAGTAAAATPVAAAGGDVLGPATLATLSAPTAAEGAGSAIAAADAAASPYNAILSGLLGAGGGAGGARTVTPTSGAGSAIPATTDASRAVNTTHGLSHWLVHGGKTEHANIPLSGSSYGGLGARAPILPSRVGTYSQGSTPMELPAVAAMPAPSGWDSFKHGLGDLWQGYQNLEIGPGADRLTPEQRSQAFWGAKLQQVSSSLRGGNGPAARLDYGQKFVRNANFNAYLDQADTQATTPEEKMRVAEMRAFHVPIKASTPLRPKAPVMRAISDTQEAAFDPDTGAQVGPAVARFKASSGGPKDERMAEEIQAARDKVLSAAQTDDLTSLARLDPTALPKANRMKPGESKSDFAAWNARLRDLQNPPAPPEAPSGPGFFDSLGSWLHSGAAAAKGYGDTLSGGPNTPIDYDAKRRRARAAAGMSY